MADRKADHNRVDHSKVNLRVVNLREVNLKVDNHRGINPSKDRGDRDQEILTRVHNRDKPVKDHRVTDRSREIVHKVRDHRDQDLRSNKETNLRRIQIRHRGKILRHLILQPLQIL